MVAISPPPAIITSASPYWMRRIASPMACVEVVHAVTVARFGPVSLKLIETWPEIMLMMLPGTKNGEMRFGLLRLGVLAVVLLDGVEAADAGAHRDADAMARSPA